MVKPVDTPVNPGPLLWPRLAGDSLKARLGRGAISVFLVNAAGTGVAFLSEVLLARVLGAEGYGIYAYVMAWVTVLGLMAALGFHSAVVRFAAAYQVRAKWSLLRGVLRYAERRVLAAGLTIALIGMVTMVVLRDRLGPELAMTFVLGFAIVPVLALLHLRSAIVRAFGGAISAMAPQTFVPQATVFLVVGGLALGWQIAPVSAMGIMLGGVALGLTLVSLALWRRRPPELEGAAVEARAPQWRRTALPLLLMAAAQVLLVRSDVLLLGLLADTTSAALYVAAVRVASLVAFALTAVNAIFAPNIAALHARGDFLALQVMVTTTAQWTTIAGLAVALPLFAFAPLVLSAFGDAFTSGATALRVLLLGQVVNASAGSVANLLTMTGHEGHAAAIIAVALASQILLCALLIPALGMEGAAIATAAVTIGFSVALAVSVWKKLRILPSVLARR